jgi:hypothetical protein
MASFADIQYCIYAEFEPVVGGSEKVLQFYTDVIMDGPLAKKTLPESITAMGCRQCLPLSVVQLKGKQC